MIDEPISTEETLLGRWIVVNGRIVDDETEQRINRLLESSLERIAATSGRWDILYRDRRDGRLWELTYPHGEMHGGGPKQLRRLTKQEARAKYEPIVDRLDANSRGV